MWIDTALRLFLLVVQMSQDPVIVEHLLTTLASRWFDANKGIVTFHRDLTTRLVLTMMQRNHHLHQTMDDAQHVSPLSARITSREFVHAFRLMDPHMHVGDDLLQKIYVSICNERLVQRLCLDMVWCTIGFAWSGTVERNTLVSRNGRILLIFTCHLFVVFRLIFENDPTFWMCWKINPGGHGKNKHIPLLEFFIT